MSDKPKKNKIVAGVLALFLGPFGVHRFYLGQNGAGVGFILGTITIIGLFFTRIISFVEFIQLITMSDETFDRKHNKEHLLDYQQLTSLNSSNVNVADEIHKLDILFRKGVITFEEFEKRKQRLLA
jgi:TM2 domain-containing membrane protein YozV